MQAFSENESNAFAIKMVNVSMNKSNQYFFKKFNYLKLICSNLGVDVHICILYIYTIHRNVVEVYNLILN